MSNAVTFQPTENRIITPENVKDVDQFSALTSSIFVMKVHQSKMHLSDPKSHEVTFNVTFAMAIPGVYTNTRTHESFSTHNSSFDPLSTNNQFFHLEFDLFSKEIRKDTHKTDVAFYGTFAKIYPDKCDSRVIPTWSDGEDTWICWIQRFTMQVTVQHIKCLCTHKMKVTVWDTKDKCLPKVRFDHPKVSKSASRSRLSNEVTSWNKQLLLNISHNFSKTASFLENSDRILPHQIILSGILKRETDSNVPRSKSAKSNTTTKSSVPSPDSATKEKDSLLIYADPKEGTDANLGSYAQLEKLLERKSSCKGNEEIKLGRTTTKKTENSSRMDIELNNTVRSESRKTVILPAENERYNKMGRISLDINMAELFLSDNTVNRIPSSVYTLEDMFCLVEIDKGLLSSQQKKELNPLTINIKKIENLPNKSKDFSELNRRYLPIYCEYTFCDIKTHQTIGRLHNQNVTFNDVSVILLGLLDAINLQNQLLNSFLIIQLFDTIENEENIKERIEDETLKCASDLNFGDINVTSSKPTVTCPESRRCRGQAKIDLSDLLKNGLKYLEVMVPVVPTSTNNINSEMEMYKRNQEETYGSYLEARTTMKVSFKLSEQLGFSSDIDSGNHYNKIVIVNNDLKCDFIRKEVGIHILKHNSKTLNFESENVTDMKTFLYSATNTSTAKENLFTGMFITDGRCELLVIESYQNHIDMLYDISTKVLDKYQNKFSENLKFLFNKSLSVKESSNFPLLTMFPLTLSKDISFFVSQPLLYVRDMLPQECVEGVCKIKELLEADSMHIVLRNKLIPTCQMLESIAQYLCSYIIDEKDDDKIESSKITSSKDEPCINRKGAKTASLPERKRMTLPIKRSKTQLSAEYVYPKEDCAFSYSCQTKNSISSAKEAVRSKMNPNRRYTYSQNYLFSGSFDPVDVDEEFAKEERRIKTEPIWIGRGYQSTVMDFRNSTSLPQSRIDDLQQQWIENTLHKSFMEPTLPERDSNSFHFDLYIRPLKILNRDANSIMPSYFEQRMFNKEKKIADEKKWRKKICVSEVKFKCHRVLPETEMIEKGRLSSNQITKLRGLRKDEQTVKQKSDPNKIPAIYVLPRSEDVDTTFTVGPDKYRDLLVNNVPIMKHDANFCSVYQPSKESFIYKTSRKQIENQFTSPFSVYQ